jgi:RNA polymerase sigma-70 factor (ECF subfamily)
MLDERKPDRMGLSATLTDVMRLDEEPAAYPEEYGLEQVRDLERFLADVEKRAFRIARIAVRNDDDALDIVQDAMLQLARRYGVRPAAEWRPLFYRILQNRIRDFQRRSSVRARFMSWFTPRAGHEDDDDAGDPLAAVPDTTAIPPEELSRAESMRAVERAIAQLPQRQQEAFMLRNFEGLSVAETAAAMGCTEGSVKTHYSRAVHALREQLEQD